ncbi:hypothetical protein ACWEKT_24320 [Nocardia takedensis]
MNRLREVRRVRGPLAGHGLQVENYAADPMLCRSGIWVGARYYSSESVTVTADPWWPTEEFAFGIDSWQPIFYPFREDQYFGPRPVPDAESVTYSGDPNEPRSITLSIAPGAEPACHTVRAVSPYGGGVDPEARAPSRSFEVWLSGYEIVWSPENLAQEAACRRDFHEDLRESLRQLVPAPLFGTPEDPGPVELGLRALRGDQVTAIRACLAEIGRRESGGPDDEFLAALRTGLANAVLTAAEPYVAHNPAVPLPSPARGAFGRPFDAPPRYAPPLGGPYGGSAPRNGVHHDGPLPHADSYAEWSPGDQDAPRPSDPLSRPYEDADGEYPVGEDSRAGHPVGGIPTGSDVHGVDDPVGEDSAPGDPRRSDLTGSADAPYTADAPLAGLARYPADSAEAADVDGPRHAVESGALPETAEAPKSAPNDLSRTTGSDSTGASHATALDDEVAAHTQHTRAWSAEPEQSPAAGSADHTEADHTENTVSEQAPHTPDAGDRDLTHDDPVALRTANGGKNRLPRRIRRVPRPLIDDSGPLAAGSTPGIPAESPPTESAAPSDRSDTTDE